MNNDQDTELLDFLKDEIQIVPDNRPMAVLHIEKFHMPIQTLTIRANQITIASREGCKIALDLCADARTINRRIEELRKTAIDPYRKVIQAINDSAKEFQATLDLIEEMLKTKVLTYEAQESKKKITEMQDLADQLGLEVVPTIEEKPLSSSKASTYTREVLSFEITDKEIVPKEFWMVDEEKIQKHIALGIFIPGVKVSKEKKTFIRRK
jgi:hypothetical protein